MLVKGHGGLYDAPRMEESERLGGERDQIIVKAISAQEFCVLDAILS